MVVNQKMLRRWITDFMRLEPQQVTEARAQTKRIERAGWMRTIQGRTSPPAAFHQAFPRPAEAPDYHSYNK